MRLLEDLARTNVFPLEINLLAGPTSAQIQNENKLISKIRIVASAMWKSRTCHSWLSISKFFCLPELVGISCFSHMWVEWTRRKAKKSLLFIPSSRERLAKIWLTFLPSIVMMEFLIYLRTSKYQRPKKWLFSSAFFYQLLLSQMNVCLQFKFWGFYRTEIEDGLVDLATDFIFEQEIDPSVAQLCNFIRNYCSWLKGDSCDLNSRAEIDAQVYLAMMFRNDFWTLPTNLQMSKHHAFALIWLVEYYSDYMENNFIFKCIQSSRNYLEKVSN